MAAGTFANRHTDLTPRGRVKHSHHAVNSCKLEDLLDGNIVILLMDEREKRSSLRIIISVYNIHCHRHKRNGQRPRIVILSFACDLIQNTIDDIRPGHPVQVSHSAADTALEYEDIPLHHGMGHLCRRI